MPKVLGDLAAFPLIISTDLQKTDPKTRKLIRSHVMRGKNKVKPSRKVKQLLDNGTPQSVQTLASTHDAPYMPRMLCSKFDGVGFAADIEPALIQDVMLFASMSTEAMFLLNRCIIPTAPNMRRHWFSPMLSDAAYTYAACVTIQAFFDGFNSRTRGVEALQRDHVYYGKAIGMLQERLALDDDTIRLSDSTIMTVLTLSGHAYTSGDFSSAAHHIQGLLKMVNMRGAETFFHNTRILIEIVRSDLGLAIDRGEMPTLFNIETLPWALLPTQMVELGLDSRHSRAESAIAVENVSYCLDHDLGEIWIAVSAFCSVVEAAATGRGPRMTEEMFLHYMGSVTYRLLFLQFTVGSLDETIRLGLLAFLSPVFLNWNRIELPDQQFNASYRNALKNLVLAKPELQPRIRLWLFMVAALSMSHEPESLSFLRPWLRMDISSYGISTWNGMKQVLNSYLWIGFVYDEPGKTIFNSVISYPENQDQSVQISFS